MKLAICIPSQDICYAGFAYDLARMTGFWCGTHGQQERELAIYNHRGTLIANQREEMVERAILATCDRVLFIDSDMRFPKDAINRLEAHDMPIVGTNYPTRRPPIHPTASNSTKGTWDYILTTPQSHGLAKVAAIGFGLVLIHTDVFCRLPRPWFMIGRHPDTRPPQYYGEDVWFCRLAAAHGFDVVIDHDLSKEVRHIGTYEYTHDDYDVAPVEVNDADHQEQ